MNCGIFAAVVLLLSVNNPSIGFYIQPEPIVFTLEPATQLACEGCSAEFTCEIATQATAAELPPPSLGWTVNGTTISEAFDQSEFTITSQSDPSSIRSTLRIVVARPDHAGMYRCAVTDGHIGSQCKIHSCIPTVTLSHVADLTILGNATDSEMVALPKYGMVFLSCGAEDYLLGTAWSRDGVTVMEESGVTLLRSGGLLIASNSNTSNVTGLYQCTAAFPSAGGQIVTVASYNVQYSEEMESLNPEFEVVTSGPHAIENHPFELICIAHNSFPDEISWTKDGVPISAGHGIGLVLNGSALLFGSLELSSSGNYCCQIQAGDVEEVLGRCTELTVVGAPILSSIHNGTTILLNGSADNSTISLDCSVTENPFQVVTWFQNGELVDEKWGINGNGTLQLTDSSDAELFGIYQCFASSPAGSSAILVRVLPLGVSNPPSTPSIEELPIPNTFSSPFRVTLRFTWHPPYYTGGLSQLVYRISYIAKFNTLETLCTNKTEAVGYTEYAITTQVSVAVINSVVENTCPELLSEEAILTEFVPGTCGNEVRFPPEIFVICEGSNFTIEWHNNQLNREIYQKDNDEILFTFLGQCTYGNMTQPYMITDLPGPAEGTIEGNAAGTMCSFAAAALPRSRVPNRQKCYDLDAILFSEEMECLIVANVSIEFSEYTVMEGDGQATVCVVANGFGFTVSLQTKFSGIAGVDDFLETHVNLTIASLNDSVICVSIPIKNDLFIEAPLETFSVMLNSNDPNVVIDHGVASISIEDDDFAIIGFEQETYAVNEVAGSVTVCASVKEGSRHLEREVTVELSVQNGTAFGGIDFIMVTETLVFTATTRIQCVQLEIRDDQRVDLEIKSFSVLLNSTDPAVIMALDITTVEIEDNDRAVIGFEQDTYSVAEDAGTVQVCAAVKEQSDRLNRDVYIEVTDENGTALDGRDFTSILLEMFTFNATTVQQCIAIVILDDLLEDSESRSFTIILTTTDAAVQLSPNKTTVTIERLASTSESTITATVAVMVSVFLVVAIVAVFVAVGVVLYKNWQKKQEEARWIQCTLGGHINKEYGGYEKASIDPETYIVDPSKPAFTGSESEEEHFCQLVKKSAEETETKEHQQKTESAEVRVDLGREDRPPIEVQLDRGESACTDDADLRNVRKISDNSSSGISVTSSEYIRICPSDFCSNDYTGRTGDSGLGLSQKDALVALPTTVSESTVVQTESDCKNESDASLSQSDSVKPMEMYSSTHQIDSASAESS